MKKLVAFVLTLALCASLLIGCAAPANTHSHDNSHNPAEEIAAPASQTEAGGVLLLKINPEIAIHFDENGKVTKLEGKNPDGTRILDGFSGYTGKDTALVLEELVERIGQAGYFVEEADGTARRITLELDPGSQVPHQEFLQDMAEHVKTCVENRSWVGEKEYDYNEPQPTAPAAAETPAASAPSVPSAPAASSVVICPTCGDFDCDDGIYCDDADEKAENLQKTENLKNGVSCPVCGELDCDDGIYCDDGPRQTSTQKNPSSSKESAPQQTTTQKNPSSSKESAPQQNTTPTLCPICGDDDCDDGIYCDDADEKAENLREEENRKNGVSCPVCGEYDCDDGEYCDDADERHDH